MTKRITTLIAGIFVVLVSAYAGAATLEEEIHARLTPAGSVCVAGEDCAAGLAMAGAGAGGPRSPEDIYQASCFACHGTGANNAPVLGDVEAWAPRIAQGTDVLYANAINGLNNIMPARGLCMDCSDEEIQAVVDYLVQEVQ